MKTLTKTCLFFLVSLLFVLSCHTSKKNTTATTAATPAKNPAVAAPTVTTAAVRKGIIPGELELQAIQAKYPGVTAQMLSNGHEIFIGKCTDCHRQKSIFAFNDDKWKDIIADMAPKSNLTPKETDELYKYILSMKATQNMYTK